MGSNRSGKGSQWVLIAAAVLAAAGVGLWQGQRVRAQQSAAEQPTAGSPTARLPTAGSGPQVSAASKIEAGRYLVKVGGCNDCHTPGYAMSGGQVPESGWLVGEKMGFRGPWGTTYASNLRLFVHDLGAEDFVQIVRHRNTRPPMPWISLHAMSDSDLRAVYAFIRSLGAAGERAPDYVAPGEEPRTPWLSWEPMFPKAAAPAEPK